MTKQELIEMVEALTAKKKAAQGALRGDTSIQSRAHTERFIRNMGSICDRLVLNWNMSNDAMHECQRKQAANFLENTIAEAELFLSE